VSSDDQQPEEPKARHHDAAQAFFDDSLEPLLLIGAGACAGITLAPTVHHDIVLARTFARSAAEIQILEGLWSAYFPSGQLKFPSPRTAAASAAYAADPNADVDPPLGGLIVTLQTLYPAGDQLLKDAVLAMALTAMGVRRNDEFLQKQGFMMYGRSLKKLGAALSDPKQCECMKLLPVVRTFSFYEVCLRLFFLFSKTTPVYVVGVEPLSRLSISGAGAGAAASYDISNRRTPLSFRETDT
jgi:hypothetical protein